MQVNLWKFSWSKSLSKSSTDWNLLKEIARYDQGHCIDCRLLIDSIRVDSKFSNRMEHFWLSNCLFCPFCQRLVLWAFFEWWPRNVYKFYQATSHMYLQFRCFLINDMVLACQVKVINMEAIYYRRSRAPLNNVTFTLAYLYTFQIYFKNWMDSIQ